MLKLATACLDRGHTVTVFTLRWEAPELDLPIEVVELPIEGMNRHSQYERFAEDVRAEISRRHFDLVVGFNKMPDTACKTGRHRVHKVDCCLD